MNLVNEPWIPVIGMDNVHRLASLTDIFKDGDTIADLAANPCQRIALMRLLICIAQAALDGPADEADWQACRPRLAPSALDYLQKWQHRFNLFGDHAFLQVDGLVANDNALADKLDFTLACGNNPTLFDHAATPAGRVPINVQLALSVLVYQTFSPGGLIGTTRWLDRETDKTSEHAPCVEGSMLHTFLRSRSLLGTIHMNLLTKQVVGSMPNCAWGLPTWEIEVLSEAALSGNVSSYLGRLVPATRAISCESGSSDITLASGGRYPKFPINREPTATVILTGSGTKEHQMYVAVNLAKHPWRELASILTFSEADKSGGALALFHLRQLSDDVFDIWTGGLAADKAKLLDMAEWSFTLPKALVDTTVLNRYRRGVEAANKGCFILRLAIKEFATLLKCEAFWTGSAQSLFWTELDVNCMALAECAANDRPLAENWFPLIKRTMLQSYSQTCPHETPRQIQAYAQGLKVLEAWKGGE